MTRLISNSEVSSWLTCQRMYFFEYVLDLEPKKTSEPITKGVIIHSALEEYYIAKSEGLDEEECRQSARQAIIRALSTDLMDVAEIGSIDSLVTGYFNHYTEDDDRYRVHAVEAKYALALSEEYSLPGTIDLIWQDLEDGRYIIVDHKSSYNFFSEDAISTLGQVPKYIAILRSMGLDVKYGMLNQLRTRPLKEGNELYRRSIVKPTPSKIRAALDQHVKASEMILDYRKNIGPVSDTIPVLNKMTCGNCKFLSLCDSTLEGAPIKYQIQQDYKPRTSYGYNFPPSTETSE